MCPPNYHHKRFIATHALVHMMYMYGCVYIYIYKTLNKLYQTPKKCSMSLIGQSVYRIDGWDK